VNRLDDYSMQVFRDQADGDYIAICPEFPGVSVFADTQEEAIQELRIALELAVETYVEAGWPLPEPKPATVPSLPSGEFRVRLPRTLHAQLAARAQEEGVSQNTLVIQLISSGLAVVELADAFKGEFVALRDVVFQRGFAAGRNSIVHSLHGDAQNSNYSTEGRDRHQHRPELLATATHAFAVHEVRVAN
jgi:antitoxin HicB